MILKDLFDETNLLNVSSMTLAELKKQVECQFEIPVNAQKWILDKTLANNDESTLASYGINKKNQNIYLYLITPGKIWFFYYWNELNFFYNSTGLVYNRYDQTRGFQIFFAALVAKFNCVYLVHKHNLVRNTKNFSIFGLNWGKQPKNYFAVASSTICRLKLARKQKR